MYIKSASSKLTPQGIAITKYTGIFGNQKDGIPFPVCKRKYQPFSSKTGEERVACHLHEEVRRKRVAKDCGKFRHYEVDLGETFWSKRGDKTKREGLDGNEVSEDYCLMDEKTTSKRVKLEK